MQGTLGSFHPTICIFTRTKDQLQALCSCPTDQYSSKTESIQHGKKKRDCRLTSIVIGEIWFIPGEKGAPPGNTITVGSATPSGRQIMEQSCLPRSRVFCGPLCTFSLCFCWFKFSRVGGASKLLPKGKRLVGEPPWAMGCVCGVVAAIMALCKLWNSFISTKTCRWQLCCQV